MTNRKYSVEASKLILIESKERYNSCNENYKNQINRRNFALTFFTALFIFSATIAFVASGTMFFFLALVMLATTAFAMIRIAPSFISKNYHSNGLTLDELNSSENIEEQSEFNMDIANVYQEKSEHNEKLVKELSNHINESIYYFMSGFTVMVLASIITLIVVAKNLI